MAKRSFLVAVVADGKNSYGRSILRGIMRFANANRNWIIHKDFWRTPETLARFPKCDGAIISGVSREILTELCKNARHASICTSSAVPELGFLISLDDVATGRMAGDHLLNCGLEQFGYYGGVPSWTTSTNRLKGFVQRLKERGFACDVCPLAWPGEIQFLTHEHRPALTQWLRGLPKPCGILAVDDFAGIDLAEACQDAEISVPDEVAIMGINNDDLLCELSWPPLSSIEADFSRVGYVAAQLLDRAMRGDPPGPSERVTQLPPLGIVQRASTSLLAVDDPNVADAVRYIRDHACDPCTVEDVLRQVPIARRSLERQFVAEFGRTPHDEIIRVRVETARRLLLKPDLSLTEVTHRTGFSAIQNLARVFRKVTGTTPAAYRRQALSSHGTPPD